MTLTGFRKGQMTLWLAVRRLWIPNQRPNKTRPTAKACQSEVRQQWFQLGCVQVLPDRHWLLEMLLLKRAHPPYLQLENNRFLAIDGNVRLYWGMLSQLKQQQSSETVLQMMIIFIALLSIVFEIANLYSTASPEALLT